MWTFPTTDRRGFLCRDILIILAVGLVVRYVVGVFLTYSDDVQSWALTIANFEAGGGLYGLAGYNYAPPWGYILGFVSVIGEFFGVDMFGSRLTDALPAEQYSDWVAESLVPSLEFALMVKTVFFVSDILVGYLVYRIIMDRCDDQRKAVIGFGLWFLCPFVITAGAAQGMFDTISVLLTLLCVYMVMRDRCFLAGMLMGTAVFLKLFPAFLVFVLIGYILLRHRGDGSWKMMLIRAAAGVLVMTAIIFAPQVADGTLSESFSFLTSRTENMGSGLGPLVGYLTIAAYLSILIVSMLLGNSVRTSKTSDPDRVLLVMLLVNVAVVFLYPSSAQYMVLLVPFLAYWVAAECRRCMLSWKILAVGSMVYMFASNSLTMMSLAAWTGFVDVSSVLGFYEMYSSGWGLLTPMNVQFAIGGVLQCVGVLTIPLLMYRDGIKDVISRRRGIDA